MSRRKQSNPKPLLKNEDENQTRGDMAILQQDQGDNAMSTEDEQTTASDDAVQLQTFDEPKKEEMPSDTSPLTVETTSRPTSVCSMSPAPVTPSNISPPASEEKTASPMNSNQNSGDMSSPSLALPKLRLNITLASDPALQPEAKDIKSIRARAADNYEENHLNSDDEFHEMHTDDDGPTHSFRLSNDDDDRPPPEKIRRRDEPMLMALNKGVSLPTGVVIADMMPRHPAFVCAPCGIKFSSLSTLEAHQTYYCSHNKKDADDANSPLKIALGDDGGGGSGNNNADASGKTTRTTKQYACNQCSYSADKKVSLNRHMRMHQTSPTSSSVTSNGDDCSSQIQPPLQQQQTQQVQQAQQQQAQLQSIQVHQIDRYCTDCDIRFSSTKTYRAHKQHYCSSRHRDGSIPTNAAAGKAPTTKTGRKTPEDKPKSPDAIGMSQPYLALPTTPIIIIPCSLIRSANVLPGPLSVASGVSNPDLTCFILQNNILQPIAQAITVPPPNTADSISSASSNSMRAQTPHASKTLHPNNENESNTNHIESHKSNKRKENHQPRDGNTTPLDLSVRRLSSDLPLRERSASLSSSVSGDLHRIDAMIDGKENLSVNSGDSAASPEQIVCAPSLPGSPPLTPSPKRSASSPRGGLMTISPNTLSSSLHQSQQNSATAILRPLLASELTARLTDSVLNAHASQHLIDRQSLELALNITANNNSLLASKKTPPLPTNANIGKGKASTSSTATAPHSHVQPQIFVKQGVSKCKECNIVFCKYENYLAHKKHYCSARNLDEAADGKTKPSPPTSPLANNIAGNAQGTPLAYQQLICAACGIKFTSLDNLSAHQMYYCPKRIEIPAQIVKEKCGKCKTNHDIAQPCPVTQSLFKCPICDVISANAVESRKHIETHGGAKAFRCSICRYKGNTLRGMRTHIRMHFDKKSSDFNEENYISWILDEDGMELTPAQVAPRPTVVATANSTSTVTAAANSLNAHSPADNNGQQMHACDKCNYSSIFKGNVVRHIKIVHSLSNNSTSPIIGEGGESLVYNDFNEKTIPIRTNVKSEPLEIKSTTPEVHVDVMPEAAPPNTNVIKIEQTDSSDDEVEVNDVKSTASVERIGSPKFTKSYQTADAVETISRSLIANSHSPILAKNHALATSNAAATAAVVGNMDTKYCNICDIKFNFLNTYIAHKQFYCKAAPNAIDGASHNSVLTTASRSSPSQGASVVTRTAETSVL